MSWDRLSMAEKADIMKLAVESGIYDLDTIRNEYNEFAKGGKKQHDTWTMEDEAKYREWRSSLPDNLRNTDDTLYDMRGAYKAEMKPTLESDGKYHLQSRDPKTGRILKSPLHPTYLQAIATDASMGYYPIVDNQGNTYTQTWEGNTFAGGGSTKDDDLVDWIIKEEGFNTKPEDIGDGKKTLGSGLTAQKWHDLYKKRGNKWSAQDNRRAVAEEVANRRRWAEKTIPNWDSLPESSQKALLSYKYNYDFTPANSPKLFQALKDSNLREAARQMDATSKDPKFKKGLSGRRQREQQWFLSDVSTPQVVPTAFYAVPAVSTQVVNPYIMQSQNEPISTKMIPNEGSYVEAHRLTPSEERLQRLQDRWEAINDYNRVMKAVGIKNNPIEKFISTSSLLDPTILDPTYANGGKIHIKPSHKGRLTELKKRTGKSEAELYNDGNPAHKKMVVFARNARKWKKK